MQYRSKRQSPASSYVEFFFESAGECLTDKVLQSGPNLLHKLQNRIYIKQNYQYQDSNY